MRHASRLEQIGIPAEEILSKDLTIAYYHMLEVNVDLKEINDFIDAMIAWTMGFALTERLEDISIPEA